MRDVIRRLGDEVTVFASRFGMFCVKHAIPLPQSVCVTDYIEFARQYLECNDEVGARNALANARGVAAEFGCLNV